MIQQSQQIWILEDEESCIFVYRKILDLRFNTKYFTSINTFKEALLLAQDNEIPDLIIADIRLGDDNFLNFLSNSSEKKMLAASYIIVSSLVDIDILRFCFKEGALDYLIKPFRKEELLAKIEKIFFYAKKEKDLNIEGLTQKESCILDAFLSASDRTLSREEIYNSAWKGVSVDHNTIDVHLYNLRKKIINHNMTIISNGKSTWTLVSNHI